MKVSISRGNEKLGSIQSVSLPSGLTCRECDCSRKCYARRIERRRPSVAAAYRNNLQVLETEPATYWREVEAAIMLSRFFRFHVSGDIPNTTYFHIMMEVAKRNSHCEILCFTKKYEIVNEVLASGIPLPSNLHMIFSAWKGLKWIILSNCRKLMFDIKMEQLPQGQMPRNVAATARNVPALPVAAGLCTQENRWYLTSIDRRD